MSNICINCMGVNHWWQIIYGRQISASEVNHPHEFRQASQYDGVYPAEIRKGDSPLMQIYLMPIKCMGVKHWRQIIYGRQISLRQGWITFRISAGFSMWRCLHVTTILRRFPWIHWIYTWRQAMVGFFYQTDRLTWLRQRWTQINFSATSESNPSLIEW